MRKSVTCERVSEGDAEMGPKAQKREATVEAMRHDRKFTHNGVR
jgi:hypothetical protein